MKKIFRAIAAPLVRLADHEPSFSQAVWISIATSAAFNLVLWLAGLWG